MKSIVLKVAGSLFSVLAAWICWRLFYWHFVATSTPSNLADFALIGGLAGLVSWAVAWACFASSVKPAKTAAI